MSDWLDANLDTTGMSRLQSKGWKHPLQILSLACGVIFRHNLLRRYCADKNKCMKFWIPSMSIHRGQICNSHISWSANTACFKICVM